MRDLLCLRLVVLGVAGSVACALLGLPGDARRAYDSSGSASQPSTPNPYAVNQYSPPGSTSSTGSTSTSSRSQSDASSSNQLISPPNHYAPAQNGYASSQSQFIPARAPFSPPQKPYMPPQKPYAPQSRYAPQSQYKPPQNHFTQQQGNNSYPQTTRDNGTNFYGISPAQLSGGAVVHGNTFPANGGGGRGGYDERWNPNFGTGAGAQTIAREAGGLAQSLRDNFPLPLSGDEAQMFQVNDFAARSNGGMQSRRP